MTRDFIFVAEVKTQSPFGFRSDKSRDELFAIAEEHGDMISIHTDPRWGGSVLRVAQARARTRKPILAKGIHESDDSIRRAIDAGADAVLVVGRLPHIDLWPWVWFEPIYASTLNDGSLPIHPDMMVVWNARNPFDGKIKYASFDTALTRWGGKLCQASLIRDVNDVHPGADAVLVGEHLPEFIASLDVTPV